MMSRRPNVPASPADEHTMMTWPVGVRTTRRWPKAGLTATGVASRRPRPMERERERDHTSEAVCNPFLVSASGAGFAIPGSKCNECSGAGLETGPGRRLLQPHRSDCNETSAEAFIGERGLAHAGGIHME
jgi:hypothetical protein